MREFTGRPVPRRGLRTRGQFRVRAATGEGVGGGATPRQRSAGARGGGPRLANGVGAGVHGRGADADIADTLCSLAIRPKGNLALFSSDCLTGDRRWHDLARQGTIREAQRKRIPGLTNPLDRLSRSLAREPRMAPAPTPRFVPPVARPLARAPSFPADVTLTRPRACRAIRRNTPGGPPGPGDVVVPARRRR
jgi:hypothetical protein